MYRVLPIKLTLATIQQSSLTYELVGGIPTTVNQILTCFTVHLTGSKLGCGEGGCGACTVMVSSYDREKDSVRHMAVNACLAPLCSVDGMAVTTVEGIGSTHTTLHPVQVSSLFTSSVCKYSVHIHVLTQVGSKE